MIIAEALTLFRSDLIERYQNLPIDQIEYEHFKLGDEEIESKAPGLQKFVFHSFVVFVDYGMKTRLIKNRFGESGLITKG